MAARSVRRPAALSVGVLAFLLLIYIQMLTALYFYGGVFILSNEALISPFHFCPIRQQGELSGKGRHWSVVTETESKIIKIIETAVILSLYVPVVLVAFALVAMLLASYAKDRATRWFSMVCQAASSLLLLIGIIGFLALYKSYLSWEHMTIWFYICVGVQVQLVVVTVLTYVSGKWLMSDWE